jgi:putative transposase
MKEDTIVISLRQPGSVEDPLTEIAREGARRMLMTALEAEIGAFLDGFAEDRLPDGRQRVVRHGHGPERKIQTGIGALEIRRPKVQDRAAGVTSGKKVRFTSHILPKWARRSRSLDALLPVLYLRGISTGDFQEALSAILGAEAPNLSPGVALRRLRPRRRQSRLHVFPDHIDPQAWLAPHSPTSRTTPRSRLPDLLPWAWAASHTEVKAA